MSKHLNDLLGKYINEQLELKELKQEADSDRVRFTVSFENIQNRRLEYIAKELGVKKTQLVTDATMLIVQAFEQELGLNLSDQSYLKQITQK